MRYTNNCDIVLGTSDVSSNYDFETLTNEKISLSRRESGALPDTSLRHHNLPHLRVLPPDGVVVLEIPEFYEEAENLADHHRDMRLDIEDTSYEELLALGDRIGKARLSGEIIRRKLKTRSYSTFAKNTNLEEVASDDQKLDFCTICQEHKKQEKIGTLACAHEYHASFLRKWLVMKNVCSICRSEALAT